jgi:Putative zinc-finger
MMDHEQAIQTEASMRYALGELTPDERDSFEGHFADCSYCMRDVEVSTAFAANAREVFRERASAGTPATGFRWLQWRPFPTLALSGALNLLLVAGLGYGILRRAPTVSGIANQAGPQSVDIVSVRGTTRGSEAAQVVRASRRPVVLTFDLLESYDHYLYSISRSGAAVLSGEVSVSGRPESLNLQIPADRLAPGQYQVTVTGVTGDVRESLGTCMLQVETR